jgi:hypothetical protein
MLTRTDFWVGVAVGVAAIYGWHYMAQRKAAQG